MSAPAHSHAASPQASSTDVTHRTLDLDGLEIFYREAGPADAPVLLLPHGYPCSSFQYRRLMPEQSGRAFLRDLPEAELHVIEDAGHWLLETHFEQALPLVRGFLARTVG